MSFASGISGYAKRTNLSLNDAVVAVCAKASTEIIRKTPALTGRLKGNWYASIGTPSTETSEDRREAEAMAETVGIASNAAGKVFYLTNNLSYVIPIEYGHSRIKSPQGMLRITVEEINNDLRRM